MIFIKSVKYRIQVYLQTSGKAPFEEWAATLDKPLRSRITARISRFEDGHFGDHKSVGESVFEARFFFGSGYRVYYS
jgi:putative addiction module killer protein